MYTRIAGTGVDERYNPGPVRVSRNESRLKKRAMETPDSGLFFLSLLPRFLKPSGLKNV